MKIFKLNIVLISILVLGGCATMKDQNINPPEPSASNAEVKKNISPTIVAAENHKKSLKRKVAIGRFTNETSYGQSFFIDKNNNRIGKQAMDILSAKLFETDRFIMLERADLAQIEKELKISGETGLTNSADFLILGSITEFGRQDISDVGIFSRVKKQQATAKVHIRIVDVSTGQIIYSEEGKGKAFSEAATTMGVGNRAGYDSSINDKAITAAITDLSSNIIENMLDKPWRSYVLGFDDGSLIISGGKSQNITEGSIFKILKKGKQVKNPQTNMMISLPGKRIGTVKVETCLGDTPETEVSLASMETGSIDSYVKNHSFNELYIEEIK
jgi:curli biogenesis system outer membrane secretion channel CsgG